MIFMDPFSHNYKEKIKKILNFQWPIIKNQPLKLFLLHLEPAKTGHAPCLSRLSPLPDLNKLYQNTALPFFGHIVTSILGKTVAPPWLTSFSCSKIKIDQLKFHWLKFCTL